MSYWDQIYLVGNLIIRIVFTTLVSFAMLMLLTMFCNVFLMTVGYMLVSVIFWWLMDLALTNAVPHRRLWAWDSEDGLLVAYFVLIVCVVLMTPPAMFSTRLSLAIARSTTISILNCVLALIAAIINRTFSVYFESVAPKVLLQREQNRQAHDERVQERQLVREEYRLKAEERREQRREVQDERFDRQVNKLKADHVRRLAAIRSLPLTEEEIGDLLEDTTSRFEAKIRQLNDK